MNEIDIGPNAKLVGITDILNFIEKNNSDLWADATQCLCTARFFPNLLSDKFYNRSMNYIKYGPKSNSYLIANIICSENQLLWNFLLENKNHIDIENLLPLAINYYAFHNIDDQYVGDIQRAYNCYCELTGTEPNLNDSFILACSNETAGVLKWIVNTSKYPINTGDSRIIYAMCYNNSSVVWKWLINLGESSGYSLIDIHYDDEMVLEHAIYNKELYDLIFGLYQNPLYGMFTYESHMLSLFYAKSGMQSVREIVSMIEPIDIGYDEFYDACVDGKLELAQWIIERAESMGGKIDIHQDNGKIFSMCAYDNNTSTLKWLLQLGENGYGRPDISHWFEAISRIYLSQEMATLLIGLHHDPNYTSFSDVHYQQIVLSATKST